VSSALKVANPIFLNVLTISRCFDAYPGRLYCQTFDFPQGGLGFASIARNSVYFVESSYAQINHIPMGITVKALTRNVFMRSLQQSEVYFQLIHQCGVWWR
jgi:hypothetical protein